MVDAVQELLDIEAIKRLKASYFRAMDAQDWEGFAALLTDDFEVIFAVPAEQFHPPDATELPDGRMQADKARLMAWMRDGAAGMKTVHHAHMPVVEITGPDSASGWWAMTDYTGWQDDSGPMWMRSYGSHEETYSRGADGRWRIRHSVFERHDLDTFSGTRPMAKDDQ
jgi:ketosteroid isomerase-like protein